VQTVYHFYKERVNLLAGSNFLIDDGDLSDTRRFSDGAAGGSGGWIGGEAGGV